MTALRREPESFTRHLADMPRTHDIGHGQQWMTRVRLSAPRLRCRARRAASASTSWRWSFLQSLGLTVHRGSISGRCVVEGKTVHVPDVLADPEFALPEAQKRGGFRTALGVPLLRDGTAIGTMFLSRATVDPFSQEQIDLVTTFADQTSSHGAKARICLGLSIVVNRPGATCSDAVVADSL
jgi:GAF domain-containing protein